MLVLQIDPRAEAELRKAIRDYQKRDPALALRFNGGRRGACLRAASRRSLTR
jgi:hypothetical protein